MIKLIASNVDGTLVNQNDILKDEVFQIIEKLIEKGIIFVVASGRQFSNLENKFFKVKNNIFFVAENGSYVVHKNQEIYSSVLEKPKIFKLLPESVTKKYRKEAIDRL